MDKRYRSELRRALRLGCPLPAAGADSGQWAVTPDQKSGFFQSADGANISFGGLVREA